MSVKKVVQVLLDQIIKQQVTISERNAEISVLYGYKDENRKLRDEITKLKQDAEIRESLLQEQSDIIKSLKDGMVN